MIQVHRSLPSIFGNITFKGLMLSQKMLSEPVSRNTSQEAPNYFQNICNPKYIHLSLLPTTNPYFLYFFYFKSQVSNITAKIIL